ncbi:MAG: aminopeptidase [Tannerellaceae bacterium]|jgi:hypothetical protein|nr:aminopeptidase [Tannerellaceae bacterium]
MVRRTLHLILFLFLFVFAAFAGSGELKEKLAGLHGITYIELLESEHYAEKYLVRIIQPVDHRQPEGGTFMQRVVVCHAGFDRPTVVVTEGYGGAYALNPHYAEELSQLLDANLVFVEHRYFLESTPEPLDWSYLTAENAACDLHHITTTLKRLYPGKWISTGISKGEQATMIYCAYFPEDVDFAVPYVAPLNRAVEDGRQEAFLRKVGSRAERKKVRDFQTEILKRKEAMLPLLADFCREKRLTFRIPPEEVLDYCVLEYAFAFWQWGTPVGAIPPLTSADGVLFYHLVHVSNPDYFAEGQPNGSFFVQAARELGYYGYDCKPFEKYLTIKSSKGYLEKIMLPETAGSVGFDPALYHKVYDFLKENDPKILWIYGETDPWSATRVPRFKGKRNGHIYIQPRGSHRTRIHTMPQGMREEIVDRLQAWLAE